ncbi:L,D-transpeptidase family protein [Streptomyces sp. NBC_01198]|uniref:L,D-transpeptidase family protein n=1 Tax=Streptomyces sp. NBC_01198 TaxID=2903769 RepID=UPI003FA39CF4
MRRTTPAAVAVSAALALVATVTTAGSAVARTPSRPKPLPLPLTMVNDGGGSQLIVATAPTAGATSGTLTWWERSGSTWIAVGTAPARFGSHGLTAGTTRKQNTGTTPAGLYGLPLAFGNSAAPAGTTLSYRRVTASSWWCEDTASTSYNRWVSPLPKDCRASESEHLADYPTQYARAVLIDFNYTAPVKGRGAGIFLHVNGSGATAGCVSIPADALGRVLAWLKPAAHPHIAIGTDGGTLDVTRY